MSIFKWKSKKVPAWASFLSERQYSALCDAIEHYFRNVLNISYEINNNTITVPDNEYDLPTLGLDNLARACKQNRLDDYSEIVAEHFTSIIESIRFRKTFEKSEGDFDQVKQYLAVRLYSSEYINAIGFENVIAKPYAGELSVVLIFDFPQTVENVKPEQIVPWGKTSEELFALGLANVLNHHDFPIAPIEIGPQEDTLYTCEAEHVFATNILLDLESHRELIGSGGSLLAAPNRNLALIYPINNLSAVKMIESLCMLVSKIYHESPGAITREIYWYQDGKILPLPCEIKQRSIRFMPPDAFVELLNSLTETAG